MTTQLFSQAVLVVVALLRNALELIYLVLEAFSVAIEVQGWMLPVGTGQPTGPSCRSRLAAPCRARGLPTGLCPFNPRRRSAPRSNGAGCARARRCPGVRASRLPSRP